VLEKVEGMSKGEGGDGIVGSVEGAERDFRATSIRLRRTQE
jgi:hypothetical protein